MSAEVVGLGASCDYLTADEYRDELSGFGLAAEEVTEAVEEFKRGASFRVEEFALLADGRRLTLHRDRGFSMSAHLGEESSPDDLWSHLSLEQLEADVRTTVLPDEDDTEDEHPWHWLAELLQAHGVQASPEDLRRLPYEVVFSERLRARLPGDVTFR